jgi:hypothetical protein
MPYQKATFVTPAFPGFISGHSTFSRAAAEVLAAITGSAWFPGGMKTFTAPSNTFLTFEQGPSQAVQLQWGTYFDASDQAGISRLWGGIHVSSDDLNGRIIGSQCGKGAWQLAHSYFDGSISSAPVTLGLRSIGTNACEVRCHTLRGLFYKLQSTPDLSQPFTDEPGGLVQAMDSSIVRIYGLTAPARFYRAVSGLAP